MRTRRSWLSIKEIAQVRRAFGKLVRATGTLLLLLGIAQMPFVTPVCYFGGMKPGFEPWEVALTCGSGALLGFGIGLGFFWLSRRMFQEQWRSPNS